MFQKNKDNDSIKKIILNMLLATASLFINGFGVYLTIQANIGASPWDVLNLGLSNTFGILYGTAAIIVSFSILGIDILMKEPIGIAMIIDSIVVGKSVDFFNKINLVEKCDSIFIAIPVMILGLFVMGYTQYTYMSASLGCGPRDTLLIGLTRRTKHVSIGIVSIMLLATATVVGWLLGGPVGIGTIICAFGMGPIMQFAFFTVKFNATEIKHQTILESIRIIRA
ncbi:Uncharacterized membrane protein YczE [Pseudobutyrivibrio sp. UC1225]|uniref:YczE/YyaS/YitT family protein n=1 Tax=Pseudobutyrivibrio sp. UC1225 TaxID=1798185 RepID=UPI0008E0D377|nr:hypothetical protein [Pseudobutyrivibrio sp. UC1225]SFO19162.1 Uncharacterized membrane protein YczE [Pseudobutyrivibrio sp. UC1225]